MIEPKDWRIAYLGIGEKGQFVIVGIIKFCEKLGAIIVRAVLNDAQ